MRTTTPEQLLAAAVDAADDEAVVDGDVRLTFAELADAALRAGTGLLDAGIAPGDRVAIWASNSWKWIVASLGTAAVGASLVPINTRYRGAEALDLLVRSKARSLFVEDGFLGNRYLDMLRDAGHGEGDLLPGLPDLGQVIDLAEGDRAEALSFRELLESASPQAIRQATQRAGEVTPDDVSDILFTSGTTGKPKGAMCTHGQNMTTYEAYTEAVGIHRGDRYLMVNPFFHAFGFKAGILASLLRRATMLPLPVFDADAVLDLIAREGVTVLPGAPTVYVSLLEHPGRQGRPIHPVRLAVTGAASVPAELIRRMREDLGIAHAITAYGLTEVCGTATTCRSDDDAAIVAERCGGPIPGVEIKIVDEFGTELPTGVPGEVLIRGFNVMKGYFEDPTATDQAIDEEGWLRTGDVGDVDERGYLRITDRLKDMFIVGGFNAYPAEIEQVLFGHPGVAEVAVIGVPDERLGEVGQAFVVPRAGTSVSEDALLEFCRSHLANFKVPRSFVFVDQLPRNAMGKVLKHEL